MRILISGANGFIGSALGPYLQQRDHTVIRLVRHKTGQGDLTWDQLRSNTGDSALAGIDAVIHLAGANIAGKRWTTSYKREIWNSRIHSTELLAKRMTEVATPPKVFICSSATGYYGDRGDEILTEDSSPGPGFLAELCVAWENASRSASASGTRVVNLRTGMVLSPTGGALEKMLLPFKLGLGGRLGSGNQYWSWTALEDLLGAVEFVIRREEISGPINMVSPAPVTNREFAWALARSVRRPAIFPAPAFALRALFGEMADTLFFSSQRAMPARLLEHRFVFHRPQISSCLDALVRS